MGRFIGILIGLIAIMIPLSVQAETSFKLQTDWQKGLLFLHVNYPVADLAKNALYPKARHDAERVVYNQLPTLTLQAVKNVLIDSGHTLNDYYQNDAGKRLKLCQYFLTASLYNSAYTPDLTAIDLDYTFAVWGEQGLGSVFIEHTSPFPINRRLGYRSSTAFTGIVIYAKGDYEIHGKQGTARAVPAIFPALYDEEMNLVLDKEMCSPAALKKWGMAAVTDKTDLTPYQERIGAFPYKVMIRKVYGVYNADLIISTADAALLLSSEENRDLLSQGNVLIIYDQLTNP